MIRKAVITSQALTGLRTRYHPKSRIGQGVISLAPWLNLVLLILFFMIIDSKVVLQPGVVMRLPEAPFADGTPPGMTAVVLEIGSPAGGAREEIVIFNDERFQMKSPDWVQRFRDAVSAQSQSHAGVPLILYVDSRVSHGTVLALVNIAREAGVRDVNLATREPAPPAGKADAKTR
jgi:biopolymer transport protein ExbD